MLTDYLFLLLTFPIASVLHGGDYLNKSATVGGHIALSLLSGWFAPIGVVAYWAFLRRSTQARAELDYLRGEPLARVKRAYPLGIGRIVAPAIRKLATRPEQEAVTGFILGIICALGAII